MRWWTRQRADQSALSDLIASVTPPVAPTSPTMHVVPPATAEWADAIHARDNPRTANDPLVARVLQKMGQAFSATAAETIDFALSEDAPETERERRERPAFVVHTGKGESR